MSAALDRAPAGTRVLLQYEPWSFGFRGLNVPFAWWVRRSRRRRPDLPLTVMFHEVATGWGRGYSFKHSVHGLVTHGMASLVARGGGSRVHVRPGLGADPAGADAPGSNA